jgi:hypothetical protein
MIQFPKQINFPISLERALKLLVDDELVRCRMDFGTGTIYEVVQPRENIIRLLEMAAKANFIDESGPNSQKDGFGIIIPGYNKTKVENIPEGTHWLYVATKTELRVSDENLKAREGIVNKEIIAKIKIPEESQKTITEAYEESIKLRNNEITKDTLDTLNNLIKALKGK